MFLMGMGLMMMGMMMGFVTVKKTDDLGGKGLFMSVIDVLALYQIY